MIEGLVKIMIFDKMAASEKKVVRYLCKNVQFRVA